MKVLNISKGFAIGKVVTVIKKFVSGFITIPAGDRGVIEEITIESFPDMGLFNIRIIEIKFSKHTINIGESIAKEYMEIL